MTDAPSATGASVPDKVDPETLVLRGSPARVVRFRRGAIIALAALASTAIAGATWIALKPGSFRVAADSEGSREPSVPAPAEVLAKAPKSYGDVPQLGPPLPGDLGRPILKHQRVVEAEFAGPADDAVARAQQVEAERQRRLAARKAAREAGVMMQLASSRQAAAPVPMAADPAARALPPDPETEPGSQKRQRAFVANVDGSGDINPHPLQPPASPWTLSAGSVIAASLLTGLNSDLPGLVTAQVTENAYDSATGRTLLIPQGARLIGRYDSGVAFGQRRALVVWQRLILPDGDSMRLDNVPATDSAGFAGLVDEVDFHTGQLLKGVALSTLLGVGTELSISDESNLVRAVRESTQESAARAGDQIVTKNLSVQPTITVRPGWPLRVVVHKDLVLRPWHGGEE